MCRGFSNSLNEVELTWSMQADYAQRIHQGLNYVDGYVQDVSIKPEEWKKLRYIEKVNRRHDGLKLKKSGAGKGRARSRSTTRTAKSSYKRR